MLFDDVPTVHDERSDANTAGFGFADEAIDADAFPLDTPMSDDEIDALYFQLMERAQFENVA